MEVRFSASRSVASRQAERFRGLQHHRGAAFGRATSRRVSMRKAYCQPAIAVAEHLGAALQRAGQVVDARDMQFDAAQRDEQSRLCVAAGCARQQAAVHGHRLCAVFAQVDRAQAAVAAQRMRGVAMVVRDARGCVRASHARTSSHRHIAPWCGTRPGCRRDRSSQWFASVATGCRVISSASTKLPNTPIATVLPIARSTGIDDSASSANTSSVVRLQTITACSVRSCSSRLSPAWSKNRP